MAKVTNVAHIQAQTGKVGEDALHWGAVMKNLQRTVQLLTTAIRFLILSLSNPADSKVESLP